jgi:hypothetical protein
MSQTSLNSSRLLNDAELEMTGSRNEPFVHIDTSTDGYVFTDEKIRAGGNEDHNSGTFTAHP